MSRRNSAVDLKIPRLTRLLTGTDRASNEEGEVKADLPTTVKSSGKAATGEGRIENTPSSQASRDLMKNFLSETLTRQERTT
jgi:hypothetical protein